MVQLDKLHKDHKEEPHRVNAPRGDAHVVGLQQEDHVQKHNQKDASPIVKVTTMR